MAGKTAAPWEIGYPESTDEIKVFPALAQTEVAERITTLFKEKVLIVKKYAGNGNVKSGELAVEETTASTLTLPLAATENQLIGVWSLVAETKVTTSGGAEIFGDFVESVATIVLAKNQHVVLQSVGGKWLIDRGEPKKTTAWTAAKDYSKAEAEAGIEPSASRPSFVIFGGGSTGQVKIGGVNVGGVGGLTAGVCYPVFPGEKIVASVVLGALQFRVT